MQYRVFDEPTNGTAGQLVGEFALVDLPERLRAAVLADALAGEWRVPALSDGDHGDPLGDLVTVITRITSTSNA